MVTTSLNVIAELWVRISLPLTEKAKLNQKRPGETKAFQTSVSPYVDAVQWLVVGTVSCDFCDPEFKSCPVPSKSCFFTKCKDKIIGHDNGPIQAIIKYIISFSFREISLPKRSLQKTVYLDINCFLPSNSVTRLGDLLDFEQLFKAFSNN